LLAISVSLIVILHICAVLLYQRYVAVECMQSVHTIDHGSIVKMYFIELMVKSDLWAVKFKLTFIYVGLCSY